MATGVAVSAPRPAKAARRASQAAVDPAEVACVAYALYEEHGRQDGRDVQDWLAAERIVRARHNNGGL